MSDAATQAPSAPETHAGSRAYPWYVLSVLTLVYTVGFIDRQVLNLLVQPIKRDLVLSDTMVSLLQGTAFMIAHVGFSPWFGARVDKGNRRNILLGALVLWSGFTALCGVARSFWAMFAARFAVGGTEAALVPSTWSLISDYFDDETLPRAFSLYLMGPYLGGGLALLLGGAVLEGVSHWNLAGVPVLGGMAPWQLTFIVVGLPGLLVSLLLLTVREPPRRGLAVPAGERVSFAGGLRHMAARFGFYGQFYVGIALMVIVLYGFPAWMPATLIRRFGVGAGVVGRDYGTLVLVTGVVGVFSGPFIGRLFERRGYTDFLLRVPLLAALLMIVAALLLFYASTYRMALIAAATAGIAYSLPHAMAASAIQLATPNRMRGVVTSIYVLMTTLFGLGIGPTFVAAVTDHVLGDELRVGESLAIVSGICGVAGAILIWRAIPHYRRLRAEILAAA